jgi:hypothetical protein
MDAVELDGFFEKKDGGQGCLGCFDFGNERD